MKEVKKNTGSYNASVGLIGNAKVSFEKWLDIQDVAPYKVMFYDIPKIVQNAYITEWFDTIGITIDVIPRLGVDKIIIFSPNTFWYERELMLDEHNEFKTRNEAITKAIETAVEMYNT
jgi:hypothetical protein